MSSTQQDRTAISIDDDVEVLTEQIKALRELGQKDTVSDDETYDLSIRWGTALAGRLPRLIHYSSLGLLEEADERRFQLLCDELRAVSDLARNFGLTSPGLPDPA